MDNLLHDQQTLKLQDSHVYSLTSFPNLLLNTMRLFGYAVVGRLKPQSNKPLQRLQSKQKIDTSYKFATLEGKKND